MTTPFLSIVIPNYNRCEDVLTLIKSSDADLYPEIEFVICDDSTETSISNRLQNKLAEFKMVRYIKNDKNLGLVKNWNKSLYHATGDWICLMCCDDQFQSGAVHKLICLLKTLKEPHLILQDPTIAKQYTYKQAGHNTALSMRLPIASGNVIHKKIYETLGGFDDELRYSPDGEYWYKIACHYPVVLSKDYIARYIRHSGNYMWETWLKDDFILQCKLVSEKVAQHCSLNDKDKLKHIHNQVNTTILTILYNSLQPLSLKLISRYLPVLIINNLNPLKLYQLIKSIFKMYKLHS